MLVKLKLSYIKSFEIIFIGLTDNDASRGLRTLTPPGVPKPDFSNLVTIPTEYIPDYKRMIYPENLCLVEKRRSNEIIK